MSILAKIDYPEYLKGEADIVSYFTDEGSEYFDCGQGKYQDEVDLVIEVDSSYYSVNMRALVLGEKRDRGDKLYFVEEITSVTYRKISDMDFKEWSNTETLNTIKYYENKIRVLKTQLV